jgi:hypothetical protein
MRIPRRQIRKANKIIEANKHLKHVHFRELVKDIDHTNFHISTKVDYKKVDKKWKEIWKLCCYDGKVLFHHISKTGSEYLINRDGDVYRYSDHWGAIASCEWTIDGRGQLIQSIFEKGDWEVGVANIEDFKLFLRKNLPRRDFRVNPVWKDQMVVVVETFEKLKLLKNEDKFDNRPRRQKILIGENFGKLQRALRTKKMKNSRI